MLNISQILQGVCKLMSTVYKNGCERVCGCVRIQDLQTRHLSVYILYVCVCVCLSIMQRNGILD